MPLAGHFAERVKDVFPHSTHLCVVDSIPHVGGGTAVAELSVSNTVERCIFTI